MCFYMFRAFLCSLSVSIPPSLCCFSIVPPLSTVCDPSKTQQSTFRESAKLCHCSLCSCVSPHMLLCLILISPPHYFSFSISLCLALCQMASAGSLSLSLSSMVHTPEYTLSCVFSMSLPSLCSCPRHHRFVGHISVIAT